MHSAFIGAVKNSLKVESDEDLKAKLISMKNEEIIGRDIKVIIFRL